MSVRITDKTGAFIKLNEKQVNLALGSMATDIMNLAKTKVPVDQGHLQDKILAVKKPGTQNAWIVSVNMEYARFQEFGGDAKRKVRHYTTPGTGKLYLKNSGQHIAKSAIIYFKREMKDVKL